MRSFPKLLAALVLVIGGSAQAAPEPPGKLKCDADKFGPMLDFEFRFVTGVWFNLPVKQFVGTQFTLDLDVIVEPVNDTPGDPVILNDAMQSPGVVPRGSRARFDSGARSRQASVSTSCAGVSLTISGGNAWARGDSRWPCLAGKGPSR